MICPSCGAMNTDEAVFCESCRRGMSGTAPVSDPAVVVRPRGLLALAIVDFFGGATGLLIAGLMLAIGLIFEKGAIAYAASGLFLLLAAVSILAGVAVLRQKRSGRMLQIVVSIPYLLTFPIGTVLGVLSLVLLTRPSVKLWFEKPEPQSWTPDELRAWRASESGIRKLGGAVAIVAVLMYLLSPAVSKCVIPGMRKAIDSRLDRHSTRTP